MKNFSKTLTVICFCIMFSALSCSSEVDFGEQYKKTVYIVNSNELLYTCEHFLEAQNDEIVIAVYCASSEPITSDIQVRLKMEPKALDTLNILNAFDALYVDKVLLPEANYQLNSEPDVTIKAGTQYGTLRIPFHFTGLDPDVSYTLPFILVSNSAGYEINPDLQAIVYELKMMNRYSGNFSGLSHLSITERINVQPVLKALSANTVRMPIHNLNSDWANIDTNFMVLTIADDGSVAITPWANAEVTDLSESFYDADRKSFELHYQFMSAGKTITVTEVISRI